MGTINCSLSRKRTAALRSETILMQRWLLYCSQINYTMEIMPRRVRVFEGYNLDSFDARRMNNFISGELCILSCLKLGRKVLQADIAYIDVLKSKFISDINKLILLKIGIQTMFVNPVLIKWRRFVKHTKSTKKYIIHTSFIHEVSPKFIPNR